MANIALLGLAVSVAACAGCRNSPGEEVKTGSETADEFKPRHETFPAAKVDLPLAAGPLRTAVFAGGCFWCTEAVFEQLAGVKDAVSGYAGGSAETADYRAVSSGATDHAEVVQITYDPGKVSYGTLLRVFFATHDPTQKDRQGPDVGTQYRSAVFYASEDEKRVARAYIDQLTAQGVFDKPIVTTLEPLETFYAAEDYHQDFARRNPEQGYVKAIARPKVEKVRKQFGDLTDDAKGP